MPRRRCREAVVRCELHRGRTAPPTMCGCNSRSDCPVPGPREHQNHRQLTQSGTASAVLFSQPIRAGDYGRFRLDGGSDGNPSNSYVTLSDGTCTDCRSERIRNRFEVVPLTSRPPALLRLHSISTCARPSTCTTRNGAGLHLKPAERLVDNTKVGIFKAAKVSATLIARTRLHAGVLLYSGTGTAPERHESRGAGTDTTRP